MIDLKLAIYESEANGIINESTRDELLYIIEKLTDEQKKLKKEYKENEDKKPKWHELKSEDSKEYDKYKKLVNYIKKTGDSSSEEDYKKFRLAKKILDNKSKSPEGSTINISTTSGKKDGKKIKTTSVVSWHRGGYEEKNMVKLDKSKKYFHCSPVKGLKELKPVAIGKSNSFDVDIDDDLKLSATHVYPKKRIYITDNEPSKAFGDNVYQLLSIPDKGWKNNGGGYYIEVDKPIKVKDVTKDYEK